MTHTNVAIDERKAKLGSKANVLFSYPNHFGTLQSFVDKLLLYHTTVSCFRLLLDG